MKKCVIISGGEYEPMEDLSGAEFIIACDKGYSYAFKRGINPDLAVGDFDSYDGEIDENLSVLRFQSEKDDTDTMIAVRYAVEHGFSEIQIRCALGARLDHTIANIQSGVFAVKQGVRTSIIGADAVIFIINEDKTTVPRRKNMSLSLFSHSDKCSGVTVKGAKSPLCNAELTNAFPLGVSNEWTEDEATISVEHGILLAVMSNL